MAACPDCAPPTHSSFLPLDALAMLILEPTSDIFVCGERCAESLFRLMDACSVQSCQGIVSCAAVNLDSWALCSMWNWITDLSAKIGGNSSNTLFMLFTVTLLQYFVSFLSSAGSRGAFCEVRPDDKRILEFYSKLGCFEIAKMEGFPKDVVILGRSL